MHGQVNSPDVKLPAGWKQVRSSVDFCLEREVKLQQLHYHLSELTVSWWFSGRVDLGHDRSNPFKPHCSRTHLVCIVACCLLWLWDSQLCLEQHVALGGICKAMTLLNFHNKQRCFIKTIFSIGVTPFIWLIGLDCHHEVEYLGRKEKHKNSFCWWPNFLKLVFPRQVLLNASNFHSFYTPYGFFHRWMLTGHCNSVKLKVGGIYVGQLYVTIRKR